MSGVISAIGVAASVASAAYSMTQGSPKASRSAADTVSAGAKKSLATRSQLLETAGQSAGDPLQGGETAKSQTLFGN